MASAPRKTSTPLTQAAREGNARKGYCASAFFASASDVPAAVSEALPDDEFCTLDDMLKAMRRVENQLLTMNPTPGRHFVLIRVKDARDLILTLVLANTSVGLMQELDPTPEIAAEHVTLRETVQAIKKVIAAAQSGSISFESIRDQLDKLPNPDLTNSVLSLLGQRVPTVQSLAGPIDLNMGKLAVKQVASEREHHLQGRVTGGYEEQAGTVIIEISALDDADTRLFTLGSRITLKVVQEEHRVSLLLAQLAKVPVRVRVKIPRIPLTLSAPAKADFRCDLEDIVVLEQTQSLEQIKEALIRQLNLDL